MAPRASDDGITFTPEEQAARAKIQAKLSELEGKDHYQVLGVDESSSAGDIKKAYFALARDFHTDSFGGLNLGAVATDLDSVFARVQEAYATLSNADKKAEYDAGRQMEAAGMSTDIAALFEAENQFVKAQTLIERGQTAGAVPLLEEAVAVNPENKEWSGYLAYARWWGSRNPNEANEVVVQLDRAYKELAACHNLGYFAGHVALEVGNLKVAKTMFRRVLNNEPRHAGALRMQRALAKKVEDEKKKASGGLGGLFRKR